MSVSFIIPSYNVEAYLTECVESVLKIANVDIELIIIDDGSTDNTLAIAQELALADKRVRVFSFENSGLSVARNRGVDLCLNGYVVFLDSDDRINSTEFEKVYDFITTNELDLVFFSSSIFVDGDVNMPVLPDYSRNKKLNAVITSGQDMFVKMMRASCYIASACMFVTKTEVIKKLRFYPGIYHEDNLFTTELLFSTEHLLVSSLDIYVYERRIRKDSIMTTAKTFKHVEGYLTVFDELKSTLGRSSSDAKSMLMAFMKHLLVSAMVSLVSVNESTSSKIFKRLYIIKLFINNYSVIDNWRDFLKIVFPATFTKVKSVWRKA